MLCPPASASRGTQAAPAATPFLALPSPRSSSPTSTATPATATDAGGAPTPLPWYRRRLTKVVLLRVLIRVIALVLAFALIKSGIIPFSSWLHAYLEWIDSLPLFLSLLIFSFCAIPFSAFTPGSYAPTLVAGLTYPLYLAFPLSYLCMNAAALLNVAVVRSGLCCRCLTRRVQQRMTQRGAAGAANVSLSTLERLYLHHPVRTVILLRLPYLASGILNYTFALSPLTIEQQMLGNAIGLLPGALLFSALGGQTLSLTEIVLEDKHDPASISVVVITCCMVACSIAGLLFLVRRKLGEQAAQVAVESATVAISHADEQKQRDGADDRAALEMADAGQTLSSALLSIGERQSALDSAADTPACDVVRHT